MMYYFFYRIEDKMNSNTSTIITSTPNLTNNTTTETTVLSTKSNRMATAIPPSPLKLLRDDSVDGTLSPVSSKSTGTDTDTDTRKKVCIISGTYLVPINMYVILKVGFFPGSDYHFKGCLLAFNVRTF